MSYENVCGAPNICHHKFNARSLFKIKFLRFLSNTKFFPHFKLCKHGKQFFALCFSFFWAIYFYCLPVMACDYYATRIVHWPTFITDFNCIREFIDFEMFFVVAATIINVVYDDKDFPCSAQRKSPRDTCVAHMARSIKFYAVFWLKQRTFLIYFPSQSVRILWSPVQDLKICRSEKAIALYSSGKIQS